MPLSCTFLRVSQALVVTSLARMQFQIVIQEKVRAYEEQQAVASQPNGAPWSQSVQGQGAHVSPPQSKISPTQFAPRPALPMQQAANNASPLQKASLFCFECGTYLHQARTHLQGFIKKVIYGFARFTLSSSSVSPSVSLCTMQGSQPTPSMMPPRQNRPSLPPMSAPPAGFAAGGTLPGGLPLYSNTALQGTAARPSGAPSNIPAPRPTPPPLLPPPTAATLLQASHDPCMSLHAGVNHDK